MTIRAKLYAAIVLTILGPLATTAVALQGMSQLGDSFDEVREARPGRGPGPRDQVLGHRHERLADGLRLRRRQRHALPAAVRGLGREAGAGADRGRGDVHRHRGAGAGEPAAARSSTPSWSSTSSPGASCRPGNDAEVKRILLGPELIRFEAAAAQRRAPRQPRGRARRRRRRRLRRRPRPGPQAADRRRARRRHGDHPAAGHRAGRRPPGAGGRAQHPGTPPRVKGRTTRR